MLEKDQPVAITVVNRSDEPAAVHWHGIELESFPVVALALLDHGNPARWRVVAKDGADLPATQATVRPAQLTFAPGEIYDVEYTPRAAGRLALRFGPGPSRFPVPPPTSVAVRVR